LRKRALLQHASPSLTPFTLLTWQPTSSQLHRLPPPLRRMWEGLHALPAVQHVAAAPPAQAWCCSVPLWSNPLLRQADGSTLEQRFADVAASTITTIPALSAAHHQVQQCSPQQYTTALRLQLFGSEAAGFFLDLQRTRNQLAALLQSLPADWVEAAWRHLGGLPCETDAVSRLLPCLGWQVPGAQPVPVRSFSVRVGTQLQLGPVLEQRQQRFAAFENEAATAATADGSTVQRLLPRLWRLPWSNVHKEVFWRLVLNALPLGSRMPSSPRPCCCGSGGAHPDRRHHFWQCPVAAAVLETVSAQLRGRALSRPQLWLAAAPLGVHQGVWDVVCLASLAAMDGGRRYAVAQQLQAPPHAPPPPQQLTQAAARHAVARFWDLLTEFCSVGTAPAAWRREVPSNSPFFRWHSQTQQWQPAHPSPQQG